MIRLVSMSLVLAVLAAGFVIYSLEHATRTAERRIAKLEQGITDAREGIKLLKAEWSSLTRPERIQSLVETHLKLRPARPDQFTTAAALRALPPAALPGAEENAEGGADPIADILEKMQ